MIGYGFTEQMHAFGRWKTDLMSAVERYRKWLEQNNMIGPETELRLFEMIESLKNDQLNIAFVAEFARGKTELINTIFFSEFGMRLLPSEPGRTTMCPTELFYDRTFQKSYLRLLPIETRLEDASIQELKKRASNWTTIILDTRSPEKMAEVFMEVVRTKRVTTEEALRLGLYDPVQDADKTRNEGYVDIPKWRHALISFPHPMLMEGLSILDTPGLNALGSEPELTLSMLPSAQAVIFVLAADSGVTKSDMEMWDHHVQALTGDARHGRIVVLNKVDTLWDELKSDEAIAETIRNQCLSAANQLQVDVNNVVPVSAQKGLVGKVRQDLALEKRSNIQALEDLLAKDILPKKQIILRENVLSEIGNMVNESRSIIVGRLNEANKQIKELQNLSGKNQDVIHHLLQKTREEQVIYHKSLENFQISKKIFESEHKTLLGLLSLDELDRLMDDTRKQMAGTWTTMGLKNSMRDLFNLMNQKVMEISKQVNKTNTLLQRIYKKFNEEHKLGEARPRLFSMSKYKLEMERLHREAEAYRKSPLTTMTEQSFVIKKFFISLASQARSTFYQANAEVENWQKLALHSLVSRLKEHKDQMKKRLDSLRRISESRELLQERIDELDANAEILNTQLADINMLIETVNRPLDAFLDDEKSAA